MKKILIILYAITLFGTNTTSLVSCNKPQYSEYELKKEKENNKIDTIYGILEWISSQEKPFNKNDNKWYFIIWKADKWIITKYKNNRYEPGAGWIIEELNNNGNRYRLMMRPKTDFGAFSHGHWRQWDEDNGSYFKCVYRWNNNSKLNVNIENELKNYLKYKFL